MSGGALLIVMPCLNEQKYLPGLLEQFSKEAPDALIVVADGGSTDGTRAIAVEQAKSSSMIVLMDNPHRIQAVGINAAVRAYGANRDWLLRVDAHCDYPRNFANDLIATAVRREVASVVVPMISRGTSPFQVAAAAAQNSVLGTGGSKHRHVRHAGYVEHGHHALMRLDSFRAVGGYREDMVANEDAELDLRLKAAGERLWLEPSLAITYYPRSNAGRLWRQYFNYGRGRARTLLLHRARPKLRQLAPVGVTAAALLALFAPLWPWLAAPALAWFFLTLLAGLYVGVRSGQPAALLAGTPAAIMHLSWGLGFLSALRPQFWRNANAAKPPRSLPVVLDGDASFPTQH